jgi:hypothetical protein
MNRHGRGIVAGRTLNTDQSSLGYDNLETWFLTYFLSRRLP